MPETIPGTRVEPGCTIARALILIGNYIPEHDILSMTNYCHIQELAEIAAYARLVASC